MASENQDENNNKDDYVPVENVSFSFLFFMISGALLLVTLWAFWDDEYARRGYKDYQEEFFKVQYARAKSEWKEINAQIKDKEEQIRQELKQEKGKLEESEEYLRLADKVREAEIALQEIKEDKKFAGSRLDEAYYYYKKAMHEGENYDVQLAKVKKIKKEIAKLEPIIKEREQALEKAESALLELKARQIKLEEELRELTFKRDQLERQMDFYKPFPFFWKIAEIKQTVIPGARHNNFSEITYKVDRCMTCHISYKDTYYQDFDHPLKTHPNLDILIKEHPPQKTGCTWCHLGQGPATWPVEDAHGSHHETDQTPELNEPILKGHFMESNCRNCHAQVVKLEGAPHLSKGKELFLKLGCHGCHLVEGYGDEAKVGPVLRRIGSKVSPSWLYRWVKEPRSYLPKTRMPDFSFNDKDALAVTAFLLDVSDKDYEHPEKFVSGDPQKGKKLFEKVGCLACHELNGKGEVFGPDLSRIANKVNADWLVSWLSNPKAYNNRSLMPDLRLSKKEASHLTAYLMQFGEPQPISGIEKRIQHPQLIEYGRKVVRRRGCFGCHAIKGMENEGRIAPELSSFGRKLILELEFGDSHIPHTWEAWTRTKLKNPSAFRTERVLDKMPNFHLKEDEIEALTVLLRGFNGTRIPTKYRKVLTEKEETLEKGRRLVRKYNCRGCHHVEGKGGVIQKYLKSTALYPPPLELNDYHVAERLKGSWLFSFLKNPTPVRTWLKTRMPTFFLSDQEVRDLTAYFEALAPIEIKYESGLNLEKDKEQIQLGIKEVNYMECGKCHDEGEKGIAFSIASERLRQDWIPKWLKHTREMIPWTKMPNHWEKENGELKVKTKFYKLEEAGTIDEQVTAIRDFIIAYNEAEDKGVDFSLVLGREETPMEDLGEEGFFEDMFME